MKLAQITNPAFQATWMKIANAKLDGKGLWKVKRIGKWLGELQKDADELRVKILGELAKKDENGKPIMKFDEKTKQEHFDIDEEGLKEFGKKYAEALDCDIEVKTRFLFKEIKKAEPTGIDLIVLDDLVVEPTEEEMEEA